jgi:signal transduction histidine kinase
MFRTVIWLIRFAVYVVTAVLALYKLPHGTFAVAVLVAGVAVVGLALIAWILVEEYPPLARYRTWAVPAAIGVVIAVASFASPAGNGGESVVALADLAIVAAGSDLELPSSAALTGLGVLAIEVGALVFGGNYGTWIGYPLLMVACLLLGRNRRAYRVQAEQSAALLAQYERLRAEQRRADVLDERARIAREIHDVLAHSLGALGIQIQAARAVLTDHQDIGRALEVLGSAQRMATDGLVETRRAVHALRADSLPLNEELAVVVDTHRQRYHVPVAFDVRGTPASLPPDATLALLRTAQEALVNAAKHAAGLPVSIQIDYGDRDVRLTVSNDLPVRPGNDPAAATVNGGYGLTGMRERLRLLDGTLLAGPQGNQWTVTAGLLRIPAPVTTPHPETIT